jgi:hypothetical protein
MAVNFRLCGNQECNLCQNLALWELEVYTTAMLLKYNIRITAGKTWYQNQSRKKPHRSSLFRVNFPLCGNPFDSHKGHF